MVMPGQFLERPTLVDAGGFCLEGLWHRGARPPALLVLSPHPAFGGGSMDFPLSLEIAWAATRREHATLRFNWRGVGASQGASDGLEAALEDAEQALHLLRDNIRHDQIAVAGIAFGAEVACLLAQRHPELTGILLAAPSEELLQSLAERGRLPADVCVFWPGKESSPDASHEEMDTLRRRSGIALHVVPEANPAFSEGLVQMGEAIAEKLDELGGVRCGTELRGASGRGEGTVE